MGRATWSLLAGTTRVLDLGNCETMATEISNARTEATSKSVLPLRCTSTSPSFPLATISEFLPLQYQKPPPSPLHL